MKRVAWIAVLVCGLISGGYAGNDYLTKASAALASGDVNTAIQYYGRTLKWYYGDNCIFQIYAILKT